jgi:hypothetical protein
MSILNLPPRIKQKTATEKRREQSHYLAAINLVIEHRDALESAGQSSIAILDTLFASTRALNMDIPAPAKDKREGKRHGNR